MLLPFTLEPDVLLGGISRENDPTPIFDAVWYNAGAVNDGLAYSFAVGTLAGARYLTADLLLDGDDAGVFVLEMQEGESGPVFQFFFSLLPEASARMRIPLDSVHQNRWLYDREAAWLKPRVGGQRVDLRRVDRMRLLVTRRGDTVTRWCMTPLIVTAAEPLRLAQPILRKGCLLDALGQSTLRTWPGKSRDAQEVTTRLHNQLRDAPLQQWPDGFTKWGGWTYRTFDATGYFHTHWDAEGERWWLVDPEGYAFWSAGQDCVRPAIDASAAGLESALTWLPDDTDAEFATIVTHDGDALLVDYLQAHLMRAFGPNAWHAAWSNITLAELRRTGFNTVGNWSDWPVASDAGFPYVRPLVPLADPKAPLIFRDFPDVFDPAFEADAARFAEQLAETRDDPALVGYFLMNEPTWGFAEQTPAAGMLFNMTTNASRRALVDFLRERYGDPASLSRAWELDTTFEAVAKSAWDAPLNEAAQTDLADFSAIMVERYFSTLSAACRAVDPNHLNLGARYYSVPPDWCLGGMRSFDVFSMNCYEARVPADSLKAIHEALKLPTLIGEWHLGAMDVGLPATGVGPRVRDQVARGQAYRVYLETAAAIPWCVGVHHFTHYDQSALGRFDGECYNIGFLDICHRPYDELVLAARQSHRRLYPVALGEHKPFGDAPEYMSRLFF
ncbi:MAG: hypothetical protein K8J31_26690 [Anaerolineae bacterium]|nr:hypothetical protein [Anaerolineae bacterium]